MPTTTSVSGEHPALLALLRELVLELAVRYGDDDPDDLHPASPDTRWVLCRDDDGTPIGCGGVQPLTWTVPGADASIGEVKRVYVTPAARGRGVSRLLMAALLGVARDAGYHRLWLETGTEQPEALALYRGSGWYGIANYSQYADDPRSVCLALDLA